MKTATNSKNTQRLPQQRKSQAVAMKPEDADKVGNRFARLLTN